MTRLFSLFDLDLTLHFVGRRRCPEMRGADAVSGKMQQPMADGACGCRRDGGGTASVPLAPVALRCLAIKSGERSGLTSFAVARGSDFAM